MYKHTILIYINKALFNNRLGLSRFKKMKYIPYLLFIPLITIRLIEVPRVKPRLI